MNQINYVKGNATEPVGDGDKIICHICNDIGAFSAGFVISLSKRWVLPEKKYRAKEKYVLGTVDIIKVENDIYVANMIGQHKIGCAKDGIPPIRYGAVREALIEVNKIAIEKNATLHMPRIGCGLGGGSWDKIEQILHEVVTVDVTVYGL